MAICYIQVVFLEVLVRYRYSKSNSSKHGIVPKSNIKAYAEESNCTIASPCADVQSRASAEAAEAEAEDGDRSHLIPRTNKMLIKLPVHVTDISTSIFIASQTLFFFKSLA